ncbi:MAG: YqiA/YcfP family alpha/beta fold hydrolase [Draconibacterium sp.]
MKVPFIIILILTSFVLKAQKQVVYLIPGQGSDKRLYKNLVLDPVVEIRHIQYFIPEKGETMQGFARKLSAQIDTTQSYSIIGVSLGGMLATEMADFLHPEKVVIISSAKNRKEFPFRYRFQKTIPIYKVVPARIDKMGAQILQPFVEPDRAKEKETFKAMLHDKDPMFLKRTIQMILKWNRLEYNPKIIHIHGDNDHTIPARNVTCDFLVEDGSHMMVLTQSELISDILNYILREKK